MKKKRLVVFAVILCVAFLVGCGRRSGGSKPDNDREKMSVTDEYNEQESVPEDSIDELTFKNTCYPFSNGLAWVQLSNAESDDIAGIIDKKGNLLYYSDLISGNEKTFPTLFNEKKASFACGSAKSPDLYYKVSKKGKIEPVERKGELIHNYCANDDIIRYPEYTCFVNYDEGFDRKVAICEFFDPNGKKVGERTIDYTTEEDLPEVFNLTDGRFFCRWTKNSYKECKSMYFAKHNKWIDIDLSDENFSDFYYQYSDKYIMYVLKTNVEIEGGLLPQQTTETTYFLLDENGNKKQLNIPPRMTYTEYGRECESIVSTFDMSDDYILFRVNREFWIYSIKNDTFRRFEGEYADKIELPHNYRDYVDIKGSTMAATLIGSDDKEYLALYDLDSEKLICGPINIGIIFDIYMVNNTVLVKYKNDDITHLREPIDVFDLKGNKITTLYDCGNIIYGDEVYTCLIYMPKDQRSAEYYDKNWNLLFTSYDINYSKAKEFVLK